MTDFDLDIREKKRIANGARHRKCGSKSRKCTLPSDLLTPSQWRKRNGDVIVFSMNSPVAWDDFRQLSPTTQKEYLAGLVEKYRASGATISQMMGVSYTGFTKHCKAIGFSLSGCRGHNMTKEQRLAWELFAHPQAAEPEQPSEQTEDEPVKDAVFVQPLGTERAGAQAPTSYPSMFTVEFEGALSPDDIANSLRRMLGADKVPGRVRIQFWANGHDSEVYSF